jgi:hypothetical protein
MQRFWETVIEPVLDAVRPGVIVEIGSDQGGNTENLLGFCRRTGATLHVIDPAPGYDAAEWQREHAGRLVFHKDLSLNVLPQIEAFDAVLIDGDHNWYTVFHELKIIEDLCDGRSREFPMVMLHDAGWPYGRRDLYYDPDTIPEEHRKPHEKKGMLPGVPNLVEEGGLNQHLHNALLENEPRSGVLTAIEDFLGETDHRLDLTRLPGIHGLAILVPTRLREENTELGSLLENLRFLPFISGYVEAVEKARLDDQIRQQEERVNHRQRLEEESRALRETRQELKEARRELRESPIEEVARLARWLEEMSEGTSALLRSRQWKIGQALGELHRKALRRPENPTPADHLQEVIGQFRAWQEDGASQASGPPSGDGQGGPEKSDAVERP